MSSPRATIGLQYILIGLLLQLIVSLLTPGKEYADYITMGIRVPPFELSQLTVPTVGVAIGALYLAGFRAIYFDRAGARRIRLARWPLIAAIVSVVGIVAIAFRTRFEPDYPTFVNETWPARAVLDAALAAFAGLTFFLTFNEVAKAQGRAIAVVATFLGVGGSAMRYAPYLWQSDLSIYSWALEILSLALFLSQAVWSWREAGAIAPTARVFAQPPAQ